MSAIAAAPTTTASMTTTTTTTTLTLLTMMSTSNTNTPHNYLPSFIHHSTASTSAASLDSNSSNSNSSSSTHADGAGDPTLRRWLSLLNDTDAAQYYNDTRQYWPPASEELTAWTLRHDWLESVLLCFAYVGVFVAGVLGNVVVIWIVRKTPQLRTTTNQFIVSLAAADLMVNCLCLPFTLVANLFKVWSMGKAVCKVVGFLQGVSVTASVFTLMAIAVERCMVIRRPLVGGLSRRKCRHCIGVLWLLSLIVNMPSLYVFTLQPFPNRSSALEMCVELWPSQVAERAYFIVVNVMLGYLGPLFVITGCYAFIWYKVAHRDMPGEGLLHEQHLARNRLKATRMVLVVIITFAVSWLPLYIIFCVAKFYEQILEVAWVHETFYVLLPLAQWLGASNSCVNPLLYAYLNRRFRKHFLEATHRLMCRCCCCCCCRFDALDAAAATDDRQRSERPHTRRNTLPCRQQHNRHQHHHHHVTASVDSAHSTDPLRMVLGSSPCRGVGATRSSTGGARSAALLVTEVVAGTDVSATILMIEEPARCANHTQQRHVRSDVAI